MTTDNALSRLNPYQMCMVVLQDGQVRVALWVPQLKCFRFRDEPLGTVDPYQIQEWWPVAFRR